MTDLGVLLREHLDAVAPPIDIDALVEEMLSGTREAPLPTGPLPRRPFLVAAAAFAAATVIGLVSWVGWMTLRDGADVVEEPSTTTAAPPTTTQASGTLTVSMLETGGVVYTGLQMVDVALGPDGRLFVTHLVRLPGVSAQEPEFALKVVSCADAACGEIAGSSTLPVSGPAHGGDVAFGPEGRPTVVFVEDRTPPGTVGALDWAILVITCRDESCVERAVHEVGSSGQHPQILIGADGLPLITYMELEAGELHALKCADRECAAIASDTALPLPKWTLGYRLLDGGASPAIAIPQSDPELGRSASIARCQDAACTQTVSGAAVPIGAGNTELVGVAFDSGGAPVWLIKDDKGYQLSLVRCTDPGCGGVERPVTVGPRQSVGAVGGFTIPADGRPVFAYGLNSGERSVEANPAQLGVAKCDDATCATGVIAIVAEMTNLWNTSMVLDGDLPVVGYHSPPGEVGIVACSDPACAAGALSSILWAQDMPQPEPEDLGPVLEGWVGIEIEGLPGEGGGGLNDVAFSGGTVVGVGSSHRSLVDGSSADTTAMAVVANLTDLTSWELVLAPAGEFAAITSGGPGFVAAGTTCGFDEVRNPDCRPGIWVSATGLTWEPVSSDIFADRSQCEWEGCQVWMDGIVSFDGGFLAWGTDGHGQGMWHSVDGFAWSRVDLDEHLTGDSWIDSVAATPLGPIAFASRGEDVYDTNGEWVDYRYESLTLRSADGLTWEAAPSPAPESSSGFWWSPISWDGGLAGLAEQCDADWECTSVLLTTVDGEAWQTPELPPEISNSLGLQLHGIESRVIFSGSVFDEQLGLDQGVFWISEDLETWQRYSADQALFGDRVGINTMIVLPDGTVVGVGSPGRYSELSGVYLWSPYP
jgi:hypothetical protein